MAKKRGAPEITLTEGAIRVAWKGRMLTIARAPAPPDSEDPADFIVDMDAILNWDAPDEAHEVSLEDLQAITQAIEDAFEALGLTVAFE